MRYYNNTKYEETTILKPYETRFEIDVELWECEYIQEPNAYGLYIFAFSPATGNDYYLLDKASNDALHQAMSNVSPDSNKELELAIEDSKGFVCSSSLFKPKVNKEFYDPCELQGRKASLTGHFRDDPTGAIHYNCEYVDIYQENQSQAVIEHLVEKESDPDDWLF